MRSLLLLQFTTLFLRRLPDIEIPESQFVPNFTHVRELKLVGRIFLLLFMVTSLEELQLLPLKLVEICGLPLLRFLIIFIHHRSSIVNTAEFFPLRAMW